jgi:Secretion system C-terminal sorting domain
MKKLLLTTIACVFGFLPSINAQQATSITAGQISGIICRNSSISIPFTSNGTFEADNVFKVQIKSYYSTWTDLVTDGTKSPLKFVIPSNFEENSFYNNYNLRIVASKPSLISSEISFTSLYTKPKIDLVDAIISDINPYGLTQLKFISSGSPPIKIVLNDSSIVNTNDVYQVLDNSVIVYPPSSREYRIAYVENICGRGISSGVVKVTVNGIALKPLLNINEGVCVGGTLKLAYSAGGKFNANNKFKLGLRQVYGYNNEYELDAVEKDGFIEVTIPESIAGGQSYQVRLTSSSPKAVSPWIIENTVLIGEKPSAEVISESTNIAWGKETEIKLDLKGIAPWNVSLSDGSTVSYNLDAYSNPNNVIYTTTQLRPDKTQNYSVVSLTSGCGISGAGKNIMKVEVKPGISIDSLKQGLQLCLGESFNVKYSTKGNFVNNTFTAFISDGISDNEVRVKVPAIFNNGNIKVTLPLNLFDNDTIFQHGDNFYFGVIQTDGEVTYTKNYDYIKVKRLGKASFLNPIDITLATKGTAVLQILLNGSAPMTITFRDSTKYTVPNGGYYSNVFYELPIPVIEDVTFKLKSISNECGLVKIDEDFIVNVNIRNPASNDIVIKSSPLTVCTDKKEKIYFNSIGKFEADNEFKVELMLYNNPIAVVGTGKTSPIEISIPNSFTSNNVGYFIRVIATNKATFSEKTEIRINRKPEASLRVDGITDGILPTDIISFYVNNVQGLPWTNSYTFSDGSVFREDYNARKTFAKSTTFSLLSVSNECGQGTVKDNVVKIRVVPFRLTSKFSYSYQSNSFCVGNFLIYQYFTTGSSGVGTTFNLQIASVKDSIFKDLVTKTIENPIRIKIPSSYQEGRYILRLVSNSSPQQISDLENIGITTVGTVALSTENGSNSVRVDGGNPVTLKYEPKGGVPMSFITSDSYNQSFNLYIDNTYKHFIIPSKTTTYEIKIVENSCGYGIGTGSVKVIVNPAFLVTNTLSGSYCSAKEIQVTYSTLGEYDVGNVFTFSLFNTTNINGVTKNNLYELGKTAILAGSILLKIPENTQSGYYQLEVTSSKPSISKTYSNVYIYVANPLDFTIAGNTIINDGQLAYITLTNNNLKLNPAIYNENGVYLLSDGSKGNVYYVKNIISVKPTQTTTYTISAIENACGKGKNSGSATVTVNPVTNSSITNEFYLQYLNPFICSGASYSLPFTTKGTFSTANKFTAQLSDKNGENFKDIVSEGDKSPLKITIPDNLPEGDNYRIRVVASDKDVSSAANNAPLGALKGPTATLDSTTYFFMEGKPVNVKLNLTGTPPWAFKFGIEELSARLYSGITTSPYIIKLNPLSPITYKIFSVYDAYCIGKVSGTGIVKLELITANQELADFEVKLFPNPTCDKITIQSDNFKNTTLQITDNLGKQLLQQNINKSENILDLSNYPNGQYFLQLERENKSAVYKIIKL